MSLDLAKWMVLESLDAKTRPENTALFIHLFATFFCVSCEGVLGQQVASVASLQPGEFPKFSSLKPCE